MDSFTGEISSDLDRSSLCDIEKLSFKCFELLIFFENFTHSSTYPKDYNKDIGPPPRSFMNQQGLFEFSGMSYSDAGLKLI